MALFAGPPGRWCLCGRLRLSRLGSLCLMMCVLWRVCDASARGFLFRLIRASLREQRSPRTLDSVDSRVELWFYEWTTILLFLRIWYLCQMNWLLQEDMFKYMLICNSVAIFFMITSGSDKIKVDANVWRRSVNVEWIPSQVKRIRSISTIRLEIREPKMFMTPFKQLAFVSCVSFFAFATALWEQWWYLLLHRSVTLV